MLTFALLLSLGIDLPNMAEMRVGVAGVAPDGSAYALRFSWRLDGDGRGKCGYPDSPEQKHPDGVALVLCHTGGACEEPRWIYRLPRAGTSLDERVFADQRLVAAAQLDLTLCTKPSDATRQLAGAKQALAKAGVDLSRHGEPLRRAKDKLNLGTLVLPAAAVGAPADVTLGRGLVNVAVAPGLTAYVDWLLASTSSGKPRPVRQVHLFDGPYNGTPVSLEAGFWLPEAKRVLIFATASMLAEGFISERERMHPFDGAPWELTADELRRALGLGADAGTR